MKLIIYRLSVETVCAIAPRWRVAFCNPRKSYGLFCIIDLPNTEIEFRWSKNKWLFWLSWYTEKRRYLYRF